DHHDRRQLRVRRRRVRSCAARLCPRSGAGRRLPVPPVKSASLVLVLVACGDTTPGTPMDASPMIDAPSPEPAMLRIDLPMVEFGSVALGTPSPPTLVTITNAGDKPTGALTVALVGAGAPSFSASGSTCGQSLGAGASCTVVVTFTPLLIAGLHANLT